MLHTALRRLPFPPFVCLKCTRYPPCSLWHPFFFFFFLLSGMCFDCVFLSFLLYFLPSLQSRQLLSVSLSLINISLHFSSRFLLILLPLVPIIITTTCSNSPHLYVTRAISSQTTKFYLSLSLSLPLAFSINQRSMAPNPSGITTLFQFEYLRRDTSFPYTSANAIDIPLYMYYCFCEYIGPFCQNSLLPTLFCGVVSLFAQGHTMVHWFAFAFVFFHMFVLFALSTFPSYYYPCHGLVFSLLNYTFEHSPANDPNFFYLLHFFPSFSHIHDFSLS